MFVYVTMVTMVLFGCINNLQNGGVISVIVTDFVTICDYIVNYVVFTDFSHRFCDYAVCRALSGPNA